MSRIRGCALVALSVLVAQTRGDDAMPVLSSARPGGREGRLGGRVEGEGGCRAVVVKQRTTCTGGCTGNSTCELVDPTDPTTGCMCKAGPAPLPPVC
jgi:hypothetical protein